MKSDKIKENIREECIKCNQCLNACTMLREIGDDFFTLIDNNKIEAGKDKCTLCFLCNEVCPKKLDIQGYYRSLKLEKRRPIMSYYAKSIHKKRLKNNGK